MAERNEGVVGRELLLSPGIASDIYNRNWWLVLPVECKVQRGALKMRG